MITAISTITPAVTMLSRLPPTTMHTIAEIAKTEIHGNSGVMASTTLGTNKRTTKPATTGISTTLTMSQAMAPASSGMYCPANHKVNIGVKIGASSVDTEVMVTDTPTSPRARSLTTFADVPP